MSWGERRKTITTEQHLNWGGCCWLIEYIYICCPRNHQGKCDASLDQHLWHRRPAFSQPCLSPPLQTPETMTSRHLPPLRELFPFDLLISFSASSSAPLTGLFHSEALSCRLIFQPYPPGVQLPHDASPPPPPFTNPLPVRLLPQLPSNAASPLALLLLTQLACSITSVPP
jgi:hypothetical protein